MLGYKNPDHGLMDHFEIPQFQVDQIIQYISLHVQGSYQQHS